MKLFKCKKMGDVSNVQCYDCFTNGLSKESYPSRVLCKRGNIEGEITVDSEAEQPALVLDQTA